MKNSYVSFIALIALCFVWQAQAMSQSQKEKLLLLRDRASEKYRAALKDAGKNSQATAHARKVFTHISDKINAYNAAIDAYDAEQEAENQNPEYNPATSQVQRNMARRHDDAVKAYKDAYGPLV